MGFFKNINANPRTGSIITCPDGLSIYTGNRWRKFAEKDILGILDNARVVERSDGSCVDIDDIFSGRVSDENVLYELILRSICTHPISLIIYFLELSNETDQIHQTGIQMGTRMITISGERAIFDQQEIYFRGWFSSHDVIRDIFEKYPNNIDYYMSQVIRYTQKLKSKGVTYKYIDEKYMHSVMTSYKVI